MGSDVKEAADQQVTIANTEDGNAMCNAAARIIQRRLALWAQRYPQGGLRLLLPDGDDSRRYAALTAPVCEAISEDEPTNEFLRDVMVDLFPMAISLVMLRSVLHDLCSEIPPGPWPVA